MYKLGVIWDIWLVDRKLVVQAWEIMTCQRKRLVFCSVCIAISIWMNVAEESYWISMKYYIICLMVKRHSSKSQTTKTSRILKNEVHTDSETFRCWMTKMIWSITRSLYLTKKNQNHKKAANRKVVHHETGVSPSE
jgi:hypothetical protein